MGTQFNSNKDLNCRPISFKLGLQILIHISKASLLKNLRHVCKKYVTLDKSSK